MIRSLTILAATFMLSGCATSISESMPSADSARLSVRTDVATDADDARERSDEDSRETEDKPECEAMCSRKAHAVHKECLASGRDERTCERAAEAAYGECLEACEDDCDDKDDRDWDDKDDKDDDRDWDDKDDDRDWDDKDDDESDDKDDSRDRCTVGCERKAKAWYYDCMDKGAAKERCIKGSKKVYADCLIGCRGV